MDNKPTLKEIAKATSLSISTVSRAMTNPEMVKASTRRKIEKAVMESQKHYSNSRTGMVAVIVPDVMNPFFPLMLTGIDSISSLTDVTIILCNSGGDTKKEDIILEKLLDTGIDGIIFIPSSDVSSFTQQVIKDNSVPIVFLDRNPGIDNVNMVSTGNFDGMYQATKYLVTLGHKDILFLGGRESTSTNKERYQGYIKAMEESFDTPTAEPVYADYNFNKAYTAINKMIEDHSFNFTAICSANDVMALGAIKALNENKIRVPEDVSVIGYDDIPSAEYSGLTTVRQPFMEMGRNAMYQLTSMINDSRTPVKNTYLPTSIVFRSSCAINEKRR